MVKEFHFFQKQKLRWNSQEDYKLGHITNDTYKNIRSQYEVIKTKFKS